MALANQEARTRGRLLPSRLSGTGSICRRSEWRALDDYTAANWQPGDTKIRLRESTRGPD